MIFASLAGANELWDANYDRNYTNAQRPRRPLNCVICSQILYDIVPYTLDTLYPSSFFSEILL